MGTGYFPRETSETINLSIDSNFTYGMVMNLNVYGGYRIKIKTLTRVNIGIMHWPKNLKYIQFCGSRYTVVSLPKYLPECFKQGYLSNLVVLGNRRYPISYTGDDYKYWDIKSVAIFGFLLCRYMNKKIIVENPWKLSFEYICHGLGLQTELFVQGNPLIFHKLLKCNDKYCANIFIEFILMNNV